MNSARIEKKVHKERGTAEREAQGAEDRGVVGAEVGRFGERVSLSPVGEAPEKFWILCLGMLHFECILMHMIRQFKTPY